MKKRHQFLAVALLIQIPLFAYPILRLCQWLHVGTVQTVAVFLPLFFSQIVARLYLRQASYGLLFWLRRSADLWLGISPVLFCMLIATEVPVAFGWIAAYNAALALVCMAFALAAYSVVNAYSPSVVEVKLSSRKVASTVRFAQITDVHIGSRTSAFLTRVMEKVNCLNIDFLCITGDFIDATGVTENALAALRSSRVPIYFSIGNHERYEDLDAILDRLKRLGVTVLRSRTITHGEVQLIGIDDAENPAQVQRELATLELDAKQFLLLMYHRPRGLRAAAKAGVDLMISGHTHNGQIVPFNFIVARVFKKTVGLFEEGATRLYVSPGTGTWGPVMRLGSRGEVTLFEVQPLT
ncbi:MAG: metallophosphoesterase [Halioglobus sp.]|nr:metallophosphoesterase [Halioglobus sp.]